ncbi:hypothetical protein [Reichenbachiella sp.]|uniref:hypothetical protein n=1 Tax=Reichenbachiella sp. TaxID=2184521 RepID=UPI003B59715F
MKPELIKKLGKNGYRVYQNEGRLIIRMKIFGSWGLLILFGILGFTFSMLGLLILVLFGNWEGLLALGVGIVLLLAPFFNYLTASYRSLVIDRNDKTILFRAGHSRAYLFTDVKDVKLEVQAKQADTNAFSDSNQEFHYTITAYMNRGDLEEIVALKFRNEENERLMFELKDYFQILLS